VYLDKKELIILKQMKTYRNILTNSSTINSRNGNGVFCSGFTGRNIADTGSGFKDIID